jgi:Spy/CpxP family protein refolding chaperone
MKRDWLLYLVIFSLDLNLGMVGTYVYSRYQEKPESGPPEGKVPGGKGHLFRALSMEPDQKEVFHRLFPPHRQEVSKLRSEIGRQRSELFELLKPAQPAEEMITAKIQEISHAQGELEKETVRFLLAIKKTLRPEQQAMLLDLVGQRLCSDKFCGPGFQHMRGRGGRGMGPQHGGPPAWREAPE